MNAGFPRSLRLTEAREYNRVFSQSGRIVSPGLVLLFRENDLNYDRLGLAITKKHVKGAVQRNVVKRLVREHFRTVQKRAPGADIVIVSRAGLDNLDRRQICQQLGFLWEKLQKLRVQPRSL